jgi:predicted transposase YbfD/YdcC
VYPPPEILLLVLCATLSAMENFVEILLSGRKRLDLTGALVAIDAMGTQTEIAEKIVRRGRDCLLPLKANRPALHRDVVAFFDERPAGMLETPHPMTDADHGRIEERRHAVRHEVDCLFSDRRYADEPPFPHLATIGTVESRVERNGAVARERRCHLSSAPPDAKTFAAAVRAHWRVENRLHWVIDLVFHDDLARLRTGDRPQNMAVVNHIAMNLVRHPREDHSVEVRRKLANLNPDCLEALMRQTSPLSRGDSPAIEPSRRASIAPTEGRYGMTG